MDRKIVLTCEHAGNKVPEAYNHLFQGKEAILKTHRGYDIGALDLTHTLGNVMEVELTTHHITRLLIDLNRSLSNPSAFSEFTKSLSSSERQKLIQEIYISHRKQVEDRILSLVQQGNQVLHLSVHTFTPVLNGVVRKADVGLLYDPRREREKSFCRIWNEQLQEQLSSLRVRMNYPYRGSMDGFTTSLRKEYEDRHYLGIELEVNQKFPQSDDSSNWEELQQLIASCFQSAFYEEVEALPEVEH